MGLDLMLENNSDSALVKTSVKTSLKKSVKTGDLLLTPEKVIIIEDTAIISDLHLGIEQSMPGSVPRLQIREIVESVEDIFKSYEIDRLIVNGDMKHEFSQNMPYEWDDVRYFVESVQEFGELSVVRGNHDNYLAAILAKYGIKLEKSIQLKDWTIAHGHEAIEAEKLIIGHEHPSIRIRSGYASYTYPCFLRSKKVELGVEKELIVLPAFSPMVTGSDVITTFSFLSPILNSFSSSEIGVYAVEDRVYSMGNLKKLREIVERRI
jgi:hypothetical protein